MKRFFGAFFVIGLIVAGSVAFQACDSSSSTAPTGSILDEITGYQGWTVLDAVVGPDPFLAAAHGVNNGFIRVVYASQGPDANGTYPEGTIIVKELRDADGNVVGPLTIMLKRGSDFNPAGNGWEWAMTNDTRDSIALHGDNQAMALCANCHTQANAAGNGSDWVFKHPKEYTVDDMAAFLDFANWEKVAENFGPDPFLGQAHGVKDSLHRIVWMNYRLKAFDGKYPTGMIIVKELKDRNGNSVGPLTVMVKRGGNFNPDGNGWEWFMTSPARDTIMTRGDNSTAANGICAGCHSQANTGDNGVDWVFTRP